LIPEALAVAAVQGRLKVTGPNEFVDGAEDSSLGTVHEFREFSSADSGYITLEDMECEYTV
jgi:hypothetical protein